MSETSFVKRRWKLLVNIATAIALVGLVYAVRHQLVETIQNFSKVNLWVLLLLFPIQWVNYHAQAKMYQGLFRMVGNKLSYRFLFETSLELNFVNSVFPSGGVYWGDSRPSAGPSSKAFLVATAYSPWAAMP